MTNKSTIANLMIEQPMQSTRDKAACWLVIAATYATCATSLLSPAIANAQVCSHALGGQMSAFGTNHTGVAVAGYALRGSTIGILISANYLDQCGLFGNGDRSVVTNMTVGSLAACLPLASTNLINPANQIPPGNLLPGGAVALDAGPAFSQYAPNNVSSGPLTGASYAQALPIECTGTLILTGNVQGYDTNGIFNVGGPLGAQPSTSLTVIDPKLCVTFRCVTNGVGENAIVAWTGTVTNCGDADLTAVTATLHYPPVGLTNFGPLSLPPGEGRVYAGSYAQQCQTITNMFVAAGKDVFLDFPVAAQATAVCTLATLSCQPKLRITKVPSGQPSIVISWPTNPPGFVLRTATNLTVDTQWTVLLGTPTLVGDHYQLTNAILSPNQYFQLHR